MYVCSSRCTKSGKQAVFSCLWNSWMVPSQRESVLALEMLWEKSSVDVWCLGFHNAYLDKHIVLELACSKEVFFLKQWHIDMKLEF